MVKYNCRGVLLLDLSWIFEAGQQYDVLNNKHDRGYKFLLSIKRVFVELLRSFVKQGWSKQN